MPSGGPSSERSGPLAAAWTGVGVALTPMCGARPSLANNLAVDTRWAGATPQDGAVPRIGEVGADGGRPRMPGVAGVGVVQQAEASTMQQEDVHGFARGGEGFRLRLVELV